MSLRPANKANMLLGGRETEIHFIYTFVLDMNASKEIAGIGVIMRKKVLWYKELLDIGV